MYYQDGKIFREDGPARIEYDSGMIVQIYYKNGNVHRDDNKPAIIATKAGSLVYKHYFKDGKLHREDGPAVSKYNENGNVIEEQYRNNGDLHREGGPAVIKRNKIIEEYYYQNGKVHRLDGPAALMYALNEKEECVVFSETYEIEGNLIKKEDFEAAVKKQKLKSITSQAASLDEPNSIRQ